MKAPIYLWTGNGWGKSTSAFGVAMRAVGHGYKVVVIQFMKGRKDTGEYKIQKKLKNFEIYQFGRTEWVDLENPAPRDRDDALEGLEFANKIANDSEPFLLILDEINLAVKIGILKTKEVLDLLDNIPTSVHIYLTGRSAPKALIERADYVNTINTLKGPKKTEGEKGIDY